MICPWCFHCGADDDDYVFDSELYCGICAQQHPRTQVRWEQAYDELDPANIVFVEQSLNRIGASKSGLDAAVRAGLTRAVDAFAALRVDGPPGTTPRDEYVYWLAYACSYFAPYRR